MATKKKHDHTAAIGMNVGVEGGEVRYEVGDDVAAEHVEQWMIDDGVVECNGGCHLRTAPAEHVGFYEDDEPIEEVKSAFLNGDNETTGTTVDAPVSSHEGSE